MIIDANMYYLPESLFTDPDLLKQFIEEVPEKYDWHARLEEIPGTGRKQIILEKPLGSANLNYVQGEYTLEKQLADLDKAGVDKALLKTPGCQEWMSLSMCRYFNDAMAEHAEKSGRRLIPVAVVPPYGRPEELEELERCRKQLGFRSVQVSAHYGDAYLDDPRFSKFFEKVSELGMTVYVHHTPIPTEYRAFCDYANVRRSYGRCVDQGLAIGRELFSDFFERYPDLIMVHSMLGGGFFAISELIMPHASKSQGEVKRFQTDNSAVAEHYRRNVYFEMSHAKNWGKEQLECAVRVYGADHVIFGSSYPVRREWLLEGADFIRSLDLTEEEKQLILGGNAERLYLQKETAE